MAASASDSRLSEKCIPNDGSCTEFILVRHGETIWNAIGKMQVAERLSKEANISAIYSSDLKRALETAETIASKCGGLEVIKDEDLRERHIGELQGVVYDKSLSITNPKAFEALISGDEVPGGGKSRDQLYKRSKSSLQRIAQKHRGARVVVVTHGEVIRNLHREMVPSEGHPGAVSNASGQLDIDLNEVGRQQAVAVADRLSKEPNISGIYSSDLKRALKTSETIASRCGGLDGYFCTSYQ